MARRFLYLFVQDFAFDWRRKGDSTLASGGLPMVLTRRVAGSEIVMAADHAAAQQGIAVGRSLADARAMQPGLKALEADPAADRRRLEQLATWCQRYTPMVAVEPPYALIRDITGAAHLHGDEERLAQDAEDRLDAAGYSACWALAGTADAALALVSGTGGVLSSNSTAILGLE